MCVFRGLALPIQGSESEAYARDDKTTASVLTWTLQLNILTRWPRRRPHACDTTCVGAVLTWTVYLLAQHPDNWQRCGHGLMADAHAHSMCWKPIYLNAPGRPAQGFCLSSHR